MAAVGPLAEANLYRFSSKEWHPNSGLVYYLYRYYEPALQRWVNRDPIGEWGDFNLFTYVRNNPVDYWDPFGLFEAGRKCKEKSTQDRPNRVRAPKDPFADGSKPMRPALGHSDFYGSDYFDFVKEDLGKTAPHPFGGDPCRHFRTREEVIPDLEKALEAGNKDKFERYLHQLQDFYVHRGKGYEWAPWRFKFGHFFAFPSPDRDERAWHEANKETEYWVKLWFELHGPPEKSK